MMLATIPKGCPKIYMPIVLCFICLLFDAFLCVHIMRFYEHHTCFKCFVHGCVHRGQQIEANKLRPTNLGPIARMMMMAIRMVHDGKDDDV